MADPSSYRPASGTVPTGPGVYRFRDPHGRVLYVGKAKNLRARLSSYFSDLHTLHPRTQQLVRTAASVDWTVVSTEVEALQLEYTWIKEFDPRFNVRYRDDKSYPSLAVTVGEEFPRLQVMRGPRRPGVRYFGPYAHAWAIRETLDVLVRVFPARTCSAGVFRRARASGRPCLLGYIDKCSAPCVGRVSAGEHRQIVDEFCDFMSGSTGKFVTRLTDQMERAARDLEYERAARLRDDIGALRRVMEKQAVVLPDGADADVVAFAEDPLEAAAQVFLVRGGRVRGQRGWVVDRVSEIDTSGLVEQFITQLYLSGEQADIPREVLVPALPPDPDVVAALLSELRGRKVDLRVPRRGDKRALLKTVERNAGESLSLHKLRRASDLTARSQALREVQEALALPEAPLRIECFDVSTLRGTSTVASMVVFEDGLARKGEYRRFAVRGGERPPPDDADQVGGGADRREDAGQDDVSAMYEVVRRRFHRYLTERQATGELDTTDPSDPIGSTDPPRPPGPTDPPGPAGGRGEADGRRSKFAYPPNLVVVDGGAPQVAAARRALDELAIEDVAVCGLAKRLEEVWLPDTSEPVILSRSSEALYLLQRVRDEAHRFAIAYHRRSRSATMTESALDGVPGLGPARRTALLRHFGSLTRVRAATEDELVAVPGVGRHTARALVTALLDPAAAPSPAVNPATGEILDQTPPAAGEGVAGEGS